MDISRTDPTVPDPDEPKLPRPRRLAVVVGGGVHRSAVLAQLFLMSEPVQAMSQPVQVSVCGGCGHGEAVHAGGNCLHGGLLDGCECHGYVPDMTLAG